MVRSVAAAAFTTGTGFGNDASRTMRARVSNHEAGPYGFARRHTLLTPSPVMSPGFLSSFQR